MNIFNADKLKKIVENILKSECNHSSVNPKNHHYCPDCGKKVEVKWVTIRCKVCGHFRKPRKSEKIKPIRKYCFHCGSDKWDYHYYYEPGIPESVKTISIKKIEEQKESRKKTDSFKSNTDVWIECDEKQSKFLKNIIKFRK